MISRQKNFVSFAAIFVFGLTAGIALVLWLQAKPQPEPDTSRLKDLLSSTARKEFGLPPLVDAEIELTIERGKLDAEVERIKSLAAKFGGTAVEGNKDEAGSEMLAQIDPQLEDQFLSALRHPEKEPSTQIRGQTGQTALVQVRLKFQS